VILYGPPAAGKDTITAALTRLNPAYALFPRIKAGGGRTSGYRLATDATLDALRAGGQVIYENSRYGNIYVVDEPQLSRMLAAGQTPVIHLGQAAGISAVTRYPARWITVLLWCARDTTEKRARARGAADIEARLAAWDETLTDLTHSDTVRFTGRVNTDAAGPDAAAALIHSWTHPQPAQLTSPAVPQR
jgi:guanylate kinase